MEHEAKALGKQVREFEGFDLVPFKHDVDEVRLTCTEFTSRCPVTGQPDFAEFVIRYKPGEHIVETKTLKLWLATFRDQPEFNEALVATMADYLFGELKPVWLELRGDFKVRGGIQPTAIATRGERS